MRVKRKKSIFKLLLTRELLLLAALIVIYGIFVLYETVGA